VGTTSDDIRSQIADTREATRDTAEALAQRFDMGQRAQDVMREVTRTTREQPTQALAAAVAVGFVAGRLTKRRRR